MTTTTAINASDDLSLYKNLVSHIRSTEEDERRLTIVKIPELILHSLESKNEILNQLLLLIYNLSTDSDLYENLTLSNRTPIIRHLLRLYTNTIREPRHEQVDALAKLVKHANSPELLVELTNALYHCVGCQLVDDALSEIREKATANLYPEALLMIHSIMAIR